MAVKKEVIRAYVLKNAIEHEGKATQGPVINSLFNEGLKKTDIKKTAIVVNGILKEVNKLSKEEQEKEFKPLQKYIGKRPEREGLPELDNVKGKIKMRFSPSASGPFHIGHALTASISFLYVEKYGGEFYVRIEDTNPDNSYKDSYKMIKEDSDWLFKKKAKIMIQSERMKIYYNYLEKLIKKKAAYVCTCDSEIFKQFISEKKNCPCRSEKDHLKRWKKMLDKNGYKEGEAVVRFKSGMKLKNPAMRDFPLARINTKKHPLQGNKYRVWPLMNLAVSVDDLTMNMTHIIRAKDHMDNKKKQKLIYDVFNKKYPVSYFLGRIHFKDLELSTTKIREGIRVGFYKGWDDNRLPTLISLRKQGYKPESFWKFAEQIGLSEVDKKMDEKEFFLLLRDFNKKSKR